ncbi:MAG: efflux RND transporter periplasmic adaptor subunit [Deltaproteobacteria bacterium]|nr:efflux RND transporter periplasmic adaptor subunit [Myxococcales bacterium]MDP3217055.1 efflux RND transporter periplasmic adaptor subunit [Deltaproteobacteria bacterium]
MRARVMVLSVVIAATACRDPAPAPAAPAEPARPAAQVVELTAEGMTNAQVRTVTLTPSALAARLPVIGTLMADPQRVARVGARFSGRVLALRAGLGDVVRAGAPLAEIDTVELHQVSTEYLTAVARARQATDALARQRALVGERVGALMDLRRLEADADAANATLHEAEEHLHVLGLTEPDIRSLRARTTHGESRSVVRSPIAGRVLAFPLALGQVVTGTEEVATVAQPGAVWAVLRVPEADIASVFAGAAVEVRTAAEPDRALPATLEFVGDLVDPVTRMVECRAPLAGIGGTLRAGMSLAAWITLRAGPSALWIPAEAVLTHESSPVVFVQVGERRFAPRPVSVGAPRAGQVPVTAGVAAGDVVVVHGAFSLRGELERAELEED